ncbi:MAG: hypothetical protein JRN15_20185 [Nitrososphaerota archaeon]|nr:hypothetical protein [Nitrososphaerota archaeon]
MKIVKYEGYLTQQKLSALLREALKDKYDLFMEERKVAGKPRCRWDMYMTFSNGREIAVEFDGDQHYRDTLVMKLDLEKEDLADEAGIEVVRIPYWVQLTDETAKHYFGDLFDGIHIEQDYPHGFIKSKVFPASYCALGVERFMAELHDLPEKEFVEVVTNLFDRAFDTAYAPEFVVPGVMADLLNVRLEDDDLKRLERDRRIELL